MDKNYIGYPDDDFITTKLAPEYIRKHHLIMALKESAFCVVEETSKETECTKNRFGNRTLKDCEEYNFEKIKLSDLDGVVADIHKKYYGKNIWLLLEQ